MENKYKQILYKVLSSAQSALIHNRLTIDNIVVGYECLYK